MEQDLVIFDLLMRMDAIGLQRRKPKVTPEHVWLSSAVQDVLKEKHIYFEVPLPEEPSEDAPTQPNKLKWRKIADGLTKSEIAQMRAERKKMMIDAFEVMSFSQKVSISERVESIEKLNSDVDPLYCDIWGRVNEHLGTTARTLPELIAQLGVARFGQPPRVGDPFCGGGSIPFEAARIGCNVVASDLNPIAAMLTWGALNIIGANAQTRKQIAQEQCRIAMEVEQEIVRLGVEHDLDGNRAKAFLYCLEVIDPQTGWRVPMAPSWVISMNCRCIARLVPDYKRKRFDIKVELNVSSADLKKAAIGTVQDQHRSDCLAPIPGGEEREFRTPISRLRGDGEGSGQSNQGRSNCLRPWELHDIAPRQPNWVPNASPVVAGASNGVWEGGDIWLERLYAIHWVSGVDLRNGEARPELGLPLLPHWIWSVRRSCLRMFNQTWSNGRRMDLFPTCELRRVMKRPD